MGKYYLIGMHKPLAIGKIEESDIIEYRICDLSLVDNKRARYVDVVKDKLIELIKQGMKIENLKLDGDRIKGTQGCLLRYGDIYDNSVFANNDANKDKLQPIIITAKLENQGCQCVDIIGRVLNLRNIDVWNYAQTVGVANAKVYKRGNSISIVGINWTIPVISIPKPDESHLEEEKLKKFASKAALIGQDQFKMDTQRSILMRYRGRSKTLVLPKVKYIEAECFADAPMEEIRIPNTVKYIEQYAFLNCKNLKEIRIPDSVCYIGKEAFTDCNKLKYIYLGSSVTELKNAFGQLNALERIEVSPDNPKYTSKDGVLYNKAQTEIIYFPRGKTGSYVIPDTITEFKGESPFSYCEKLEQIKLPKYLKMIPDKFFSGCKSLKQVEFNSNLEVIGRNAFYDCQSLSEVSLGRKVWFIGDSAFSYCNNLKKVNLSSKLLIEGQSVARSDTEINIDTKAQFYFPDISPDQFATLLDKEAGLEWNLNHKKFSVIIPPHKEITKDIMRNIPEFSKIIFSEGTERIGDMSINQAKNNNRFEEIEIPKTVTSIGNGAFEDCRGLIKCTLPESLKYIGARAFKDCQNLWKEQYMSLPDRLTSIEERSFENTGMSGVKIPEGVKEIKKYAFRYCRNLTSVYLPNSIESIDPDAFDNCFDLHLILINGASKAEAVKKWFPYMKIIDMEVGKHVQM